MGDYGHLGRFSGTHYLSTVSTELEGEFQGFSGKKNKPLKGVCHSTRCITHSDTQLEVSI